MKLRDELIQIHERQAECIVLLKSMKESIDRKTTEMDALDERLIPVEAHVNFVQGLGKFLAGLVVVIGGIVGIIKGIFRG